eukprot:CAMPEP_0172709908 /NCGR_PEP_ID=MMETSP1074-20121228/55346_1 /TAXON_ID=2916 /ORGANISM="Ceratium fusus, Strain PA161109" /LENGTH=164 /DNA_ID=CAMNT_0013533231 /DNA_START=52 /DNA_END=546 /DNA_ORIENTATION=-
MADGASTYAMSTSQQQPEEQQAPPEEEAEELEDLPAEEKKGDRLLGVQIRRKVDDVMYDAVVEEIERGKVTGDRLYRVKYTDGDLEHLTAQEVEACRVPEQFVQAAAGHTAVGDGEDEEGDAEEEGEEKKTSSAIKKKPAGPGVQATIAKKPAGPTVAKKPARA